MSATTTKDGHQITLVTIVVIVVLIICQLPFLIYQIQARNNTGFIWQIKWATFEHVSTMMKAFNSSVNFVIYCLCRTCFREHLRALFCERSGNTTPSDQETL